MKNILIKTIQTLGIFIFLVNIASDIFAAVNPIPHIGVVVKKNNCCPSNCNCMTTLGHNHSGASKTTITNEEGKFSMKLDEGNYTLILNQEQVKEAVTEIIKKNFPESKYQYNGNGVVLTKDKESNVVISKLKRGNSYTVLVPKGGGMLAATLTWNTNVMKEERTKTEALPFRGERINKTMNLNSNETLLAKTEGAPVIGSTVKAGKNPGGALMPIGTTNEKGEVTMEIKEAGDYTILVLNPTNNPLAKGAPVVGQIVKGGKNPGPTIIIVGTTNQNGEVQMKNAEAGSYTLLVLSPTTDTKDNTQIKETQLKK